MYIGYCQEDDNKTRCGKFEIMTNSKKYYIWIDNVKGLAIILVVLWHCGYLCGKEYLQWFQHAVPLFLFCSAYLFRNKVNGNYWSKHQFVKLLKRIVLPYILVELLVVSILFGKSLFSNYTLPTTFYDFIRMGGYGPGAYFPLVYVQCWLMIPFLVILKERTSFYKGFFLFIIVCVLMESTFYLTCANRSWLWRLLAIKYLMILYVGVNYEEFVKRRLLSCILIMLSIALAVLDIYFYPFDNMGWNGFHFFTSFYILLLISFLMKLNSITLSYVGKHSYEMFLVQLGYFAVAYQSFSLNGIMDFGIIVFLSMIVIYFKKRLTYKFNIC